MTEVDKYSTLTSGDINMSLSEWQCKYNANIILNDNDIKMINEKEVYH